MDSESPSSIPEAHDGAQPSRPLSELEETIGYTFRDGELLKNALVHKSFLHEMPDFYLGSNERLEFLGDAAIGLIASSDLFRSQPGKPEGFLTALRGALVRLNTLAELAASIELGEYLYLSHGEEAAGGRKRSTNLGRALEALLGAVYMDGGLSAAEQVWHRILGDRSVEQLQEVLMGDYKSRLQQFAQAELHVTPSYRLVSTSGPDHAKQFRVEAVAGDRVLASGEGRNKQIAEQAAAEAAFALLSGELGAGGDAETDSVEEDVNDAAV